MKSILYISYDSILDTISKSQITPLLIKYSSENKVYFISMEKNLDKAENFSKKFKKKIKFKFLKYKKNKFVKFLYVLKYQFLIFNFIISNKIDIIHVRSYLPISLLILTRLFKNVKIIFDIRGFWFDEKYEARIISKGTYSFLKLFEKFFFKSSDIVVTLSEVSKNIIIKNFNIKSHKIRVIPTFTNFSKFKNINKSTNKGKIIFGYIGNLQMNYEFYKVIKFLNIYNKINKNWILIIASNYNKNNLKLLSKDFFFDEKKIIIKKIKYEKMHNFYSKIDVCIYFLNDKFSKKASCPTKLGELIATNTPIITNPNIGDINKLNKILNLKNFLIKKINYSNVKNISKDLFLIKNKKVKYETRLKLKYFFDEKKNIEKYLDIIKIFSK